MPEIRDSLYNFIQISESEKGFLNEAIIQRLKHISQLGLTFFIYPGARHSRFEHSVGTLHIATKIFDSLIDEKKVEFLKMKTPIFIDNKEKNRKLLRIAALCHDIGHLPFSHAAENIVNESFSHEFLTYNLIKSDIVKRYLIETNEFTVEDIEKIARISLGNESLSKINKTLITDDEELILSEIITGEIGADRIDYLLRDSFFCGVSYGNFDYHKLIHSMNIGSKNNKLQFGIDPSGLHCLEGLIMGRYYMFAQVYQHKKRIAYDLMLQDYFKRILEITDNDFLESKNSILNIISIYTDRNAQSFNFDENFNMDSFVNFTDYTFLDHLSKTEIGKRIKSRKPYRMILTNAPFLEKTSIINNLMESNSDSNVVFVPIKYKTLPSLSDIKFIIGENRDVRKYESISSLECLMPKGCKYVFSKNDNEINFDTEMFDPSASECVLNIVEPYAAKLQAIKNIIVQSLPYRPSSEN